MASSSMSPVKVASLIEALSNSNVTMSGNVTINIQNSAVTTSRKSRKLDHKISILTARRRIHFATYYNICRKVQALYNGKQDGGHAQSTPIAETRNTTTLENLRAIATDLSLRAEQVNYLMTRCEEAHAKGLECDWRIEEFTKMRDGKYGSPHSTTNTCHEANSRGIRVAQIQSVTSDKTPCSNLEATVLKQDRDDGETTASAIVQHETDLGQKVEGVINLDQKLEVPAQISASSLPEECREESDQNQTVDLTSSGPKIKSTALMFSPIVATANTAPTLFSPPALYSIIAPNMIDPREPRFLLQHSASDQQAPNDLELKKKKCRAVMILNISNKLNSLSSVLSWVRGGMVIRATLVTLGSQWRFHETETAQKRQESCRMAYIEFAHSDQAEAYVRFVNSKHNHINRAAMFCTSIEDEVIEPKQKVQIQLAGTPSYPLPISIQRAIHEQGATRNIIIKVNECTISATCDKIEKCIDLLASRFQSPSPFKAGCGWSRDALFENIWIEYEVLTQGSNNNSAHIDTDTSTELKVNLLLRINFLKIEYAMKAMSALRFNIVLMPPTSDDVCQQDHSNVTVYYSADECAGPLDELPNFPHNIEEAIEAQKAGESGKKSVSILQTIRSPALGKVIEGIILERGRKMEITVDDAQSEIDLLSLHDSTDEKELAKDTGTSAASSPSIWSHF